LRNERGATNAPLRVDDVQFALGFESANLRKNRLPVLDGTRGQALSFVWAFPRADSLALARPIMRRSSFSKPLLATLATLFAAATILYSVHGCRVRIGSCHQL
jgi:hypothetical protein